MKREDIEKVAKDYSIGKTYFRRNVLKEVDADDYVLRKGNCSEDFIAGAEWGNFNYCWSTQEDIRKFILHLDEDYFSRKMFQSVSYQCSTKEMQGCCKRFASKILPALKEAIKEELANTEEELC